jgi:hypothetical protein
MLESLKTPILDGERALAGAAIHIVRGCDAILELHSMLVELSERCDQSGAMDDLKYFLSRPKFANKIPALLLFCSTYPPRNSSEIEAVILLYEYQVAGIGGHVFVADYHGGDRTVIAPPRFRAQVAYRGSAALLSKGALAVQLTYQTDIDRPEEFTVPSAGDNSGWRWASSVRRMHGYVPLEDSYDATLASFGKHTRRNLRAARRHAQKAVGYTFVVDPVLTKEEFLSFNRISAYPVPDELAAWRHKAMDYISDRLFLGIRGANGEWLSIIGGRRPRNGTFVEWQMNRADMGPLSLGTLMRSHLIEHEVERGSKRLYLVGGTSHSMKYAFGSEHFVDFAAARGVLPAFLLRHLARPLMSENTFLVQAFADPKLNWQSW